MLIIRTCFSADAELLDLVSVGGSDDTFIDGIGIVLNDQLVRDINEINEIVERKLTIDFVFIQSKMSPSFDISELSSFGVGVNTSFRRASCPRTGKVSDLRQLKDYIYSNQKVTSKLQNSPNLRLYFVGTGVEPEEQRALHGDEGSNYKRPSPSDGVLLRIC